MSIFITFEGPEGSGKSTQIGLLAARLGAQGRRVTLTREPGGTRIGDAVRGVVLDPTIVEMSPRAEALLFNAARAQLVDEVISPALARGDDVLCDRYGDSTLAYQGYGHGRPIAPLRMLIDYATGGLVPHLTIYLDIDVRAGLARKRSGEGDAWNRMEEKTLAFHEAVRAGYLALAASSSRWLVVDAAQPVDGVAERIWERVVDALRGDRLTG